jgi:hypothetical protein
MNDLSEKALLANLTISHWTARKYDKKVSQKIEQEHNARNAGRFNKILIAEDELQATKKIAGTAREFLYTNTLPWGDNGDRLLPATNYFEFISVMRRYKTEFEVSSEKFIMQYPLLKEEAKRRLNGLFQEEDYPSVDIIRRKFGMTVTFMPISDIADFRVQVDADEVASLRSDIETEIHARVTQANVSILTRIREAVAHMVERLSDQDAVFRDSLVENVKELLDVLPRLNFTNDGEISAILHSMKDLVIDPETLRANDNIRHQKAEEALTILARVNDFLG